MTIRISLTSVPPRFAGLGPVLESLVAQGADDVVLTLPWRYDRFPDWDGTLPPIPRGVRVFRESDEGAATKFTAPARRWPRDRVVICDDDCLYGPGWLDGFREPGVVAASVFAGERISAPGAVIVQGFAGVSFVPAEIGAALCAVPLQCRLVDDIWLSGAIAAAGLEVRVSRAAREVVQPIDHTDGLQDVTDRGELNRRAVALVQKQLGVWI